MRTFHRVLVLAVTLLPVSDLALAAWGTNPATNLAICTATNEQFMSSSISDGEGGVIVVWADFRVGAGDIYVQRVLASGTTAWGANGKAMCNTLYTQWLPKIVSDGAGGAYVAWHDERNSPSVAVYAQRVDANGNMLWTPQGIRVSGGSSPEIVSDGSGGAIVAWAEGGDIWAQRVAPDSTLLWPGGAQLTNAPGSQTQLFGSARDNGGAFFGWTTMNGPLPATGLTVQAVDGLGAPQWGNGVALGLVPGSESASVCAMCPDGAGGCIVGWRMSNNLLKAARLDAGGTQLWNGGGNTFVVVFNGAGSMSFASDGVGGAFFCWDATAGIFAQHLNGLGNKLWPPSGAPVCTVPGEKAYLVMKADGEGGAAMAWADSRIPGALDIYTQRLDGSGALKMNPDGVAVGTANGYQVFPGLVQSGSAGWIAVWEDLRSGVARDMYCQFVDRFSFLGDASPTLLSVADVPGDNGGFVNVTWSRSYLDRAVDPHVVEYRLMRQTASPGSAARAVQPGNAGWELAVTVSATAAAGYTVPVPSDGDDFGGIHPITTYRVEAHGSSSEAEPLWSSAAMGGWSVDNLAPPAPTSFRGAYAYGTTSMIWDPSSAPDCLLFRLWGSPDQLFVPGPSNLIAETSGTSYSDRPGEAFYYRLAAVDDNGNQSQLATMQPWTTDVEPATQMTFALAAPQPNPAQRECTITFEVPRAGSARLALFDLAGRRVATLHEGPVDAGPQVVSLAVDRTEGPRLSNGLYLLRLEAAGRTATRRLVIAR